MVRRSLSVWVAVFLTLTLPACAATPPGITPIAPFSVDSYLGTWYEIARLDHRFERDLVCVSADYSLKENGKLGVLNRGYDMAKGEWKQIEGSARIVGENSGYLKVSFFWPISSSYVVFELDDYQHAYVTGNNRNTLWYLAREKDVSDSQYQRFLDTARDTGFAVDEIIRVGQDCPDA